MDKSTVICGYSGIGKTEFARRAKMHLYKNIGSVLDLDCAPFHYIQSLNGEKYDNPAYPDNYIEAIKKTLKYDEYDYILVTAHDVVRDRLFEEKIPYIAVIPDPEYCEEEYLKRYMRRKDSPESIFARHYYWNDWLNSIIVGCEKHHMPCIKLGPTWYLATIFE